MSSGGPLRRAALLLTLIALSACAHGPGPRRGERAPDGQRVLRGYDGEKLERTASPSALVAEEIALAQAARDDGLSPALRRSAGDGAVLFTTAMVDAKTALAGPADIATSLRWQPHAVLMSCDGRTGAVTGGWQRADGTVGRYTRIWFRPYTRTGGWGWLLYQEERLPAALEAPDFVRTQVAECRQNVPTVTGADARRADYVQGLSDDRTLIWTATAQPGGVQTLTVDLWTGADYARLLDERVAAVQPAQATP